LQKVFQTIQLCSPSALILYGPKHFMPAMFICHLRYLSYSFMDKTMNMSCQPSPPPKKAGPPYLQSCVPELINLVSSQCGDMVNSVFYRSALPPSMIQKSGVGIVAFV